MWLKMKLPHVHKTSAKGRTFYYHRPTKTRLPDDPSSPAFMAALERLNAQIGAKAERQARGRPVEGTMADLCALYLASSDFAARAAKTRKDYLRYIDALRGPFGDLFVRDIDREFVLELRESLAHKPRTANYTISVLSLLLSFAVDRKSRFGLEINHALRPKRLKGGKGHEAWPVADLALFLRKAPRPLALAAALALYTAQRESDVLTMPWSRYDGHGIEVRQAKTGALLWIPAHRALKLWLKRAPRGTATTILTRPDGQPYKIDHFRHEFRAACDALGLPRSRTFHGLRHTAYRALLEAGCTNDEARAVSGHASDAGARVYARTARQKALAQAAITKLETRRRRD